MPQWYSIFRTPLLLIQSVAGVFLFAYSLRRRRHFWFRLILGALIGGMTLHLDRLVLFPQMGNSVNDLGRIVMTLLAYFVLVLLCYFSYAESFWTALFVASSGFIAQDMAGTLKTVLRQIPLVDTLYHDDLGVLLVDLVAYGGIYAVLFFAFRPFTRDREENFGNREKAAFSSMVLLFCLGMARITQGNPYRNGIAVLAEGLYQALCDVFILLLQFGVMERAKLSHSVDIMRELVHEQHEQYRHSKQSVELVNEKYHDLKSLLEGFQGGISQEQVDKLKAKVGEYDAFVDTGNHVLDIVLAEKRALCQSRGIELTAYLDGSALSFLEELELYALIGNTLNNAIDAVSKLPEEKRFILLTISAEEGMVTIHGENPYAGEVVMEDALPVSQRDERYHGFGMKSMERIVEKYDGTITTTPRDGMFYLDMILFRP